MISSDADRRLEQGKERPSGGLHRTAMLAVLALSVAGCSLIGLGIGAVVDSRRSKPRAVEGWDLQRVKKGARIRLLLRDGRAVAGRFRGVETVGEEYAARYAAWRAARAAADAMPALGDRVTVSGRSGASESGILVGFDLASLVVRVGGAPPIQERRYADVMSFATEGGAALSGAQLAARAGQGQLPLRARLVVDDIRVPLEQVARIQMPTSTGKISGFALGAFADLIIVIVVAQGLGDLGSDICTGNCTSCPFVESFDGHGYVLETEAFGGAIFPAAQRPDWARLDHLAAVNGSYRLRLTNEQEEMQYVDEANLLVVDGPGRARIVPSAAGRLHVLALHGRLLPAWYARLEADGAARAEFLTALRREGLPAVSIWDGKGWQLVGALTNLGPAAAREQALAVEIGSIPGDVLRVKVESSAGMWIVDNVEADFGPEPLLDVVELRPAQARTADGTDIRRLLDGTDGGRHVMRPHRDAVSLVFTEPPVRPGRRRSLVVKLSGYYTILVPPDGQPQESLFARLVTERGAFAGYSLRSLYSELESRRSELERPVD